jgi:hypothetical protein
VEFGDSADLLVGFAGGAVFICRRHGGWSSLEVFVLRLTCEIIRASRSYI